MKWLNIKFLLGLSLLFLFNILSAQTYKIVDTGQDKFFDDFSIISTPDSGETFYGQDAQFKGNLPSYTNNGNGTITDNVTGLMWSQSTDLNGDGTVDVDDKLNYYDALSTADTLTLAGYSDWRIPSIKELYSLIMFYGKDVSGYNGSTDGLTPFINTNYFEFGYGDESAGERIIDAQFATTSIYVGTVMGGQKALFGVNFADGRIKGYPVDPTPIEPDGKGFYVLFVRGNSDYGINKFADNSDGTITDEATDLMWSKDDNGEGLNWEEALAWVQEKNSENYLGHNDWRLPNVKELQSIVDYSRSPSTTNSAAIDSVFNCSLIVDEGGYDNFPFYWSSTTHENMMNGNFAAYVSFGEALGYMQDPFSGNYSLMDVHGAGAQRSDPKEGDSNDYPYGHGPQGDVVRIYNYVRLVRDTETTTALNEESTYLVSSYSLNQNYPNPFNPATIIRYSIPVAALTSVEAHRLLHVNLTVYDILGNEIASIVNEYQKPGVYEVEFNGSNLASGIYFYTLHSGTFSETKKMILLR